LREPRGSEQRGYKGPVPTAPFCMSRAAPTGAAPSDGATNTFSTSGMYARWDGTLALLTPLNKPFRTQRWGAVERGGSGGQEGARAWSGQGKYTGRGGSRTGRGRGSDFGN
jgi:hypothetical protein